MPENKEMAGKLLREKKDKDGEVQRMVTIIEAEPGKPAYRLGITSIKTSGAKITIKRREGE